jgi:hypothetical protein
VTLLQYAILRDKCGSIGKCVSEGDVFSVVTQYLCTNFARMLLFTRAGFAGNVAMHSAAWRAGLQKDVGALGSLPSSIRTGAVANSPGLTGTEYLR